MVARKRFFPAVAAATVAWMSNPALSLNVGSSSSRKSSMNTNSFAPAFSRRGRGRGGPSSIRAAAVDQESSPSSSSSERRRSGWHRSVLKKVFRSSSKKQTTHLQGGGVAMQESASGVVEIDRSSMPPFSAATDFLLHNFDRESPSSLFGGVVVTSTTTPKNLVSSFDPTDVPMLQLLDESDELSVGAASEVPDDDASVASTDSTSSSSSSESRSPLTRITSSVAENILSGLLDRMTKGESVNVSVKCAPNGNALDLLRGHFQSDASVEFERIVFPCIRMSGGRLEAHRLAINLWSFTPDLTALIGSSPSPAPSASLPSAVASPVPPSQSPRRRYPNQFDFVAHDMVFTQDDLYESNCIRNGLRRLLKRILKNHMSLSTVGISSIQILSSGKLAVRGKASTGFGPPVPFEVRSAIGTSSRGHVVTFPGLEISLGPTLGMFVPVLPEVSLDLGHNAQILHVQTNPSNFLTGAKATLTVSARATITPHHTLKLPEYVQPKDSYLAPFSVDVGRWLTKTGNFTH